MTISDDRALVLFSGGQDSTTCLAWALERYAHVETLGFDYGQRHRVELEVRPQVLAAMRERLPHLAARLGEDHMIDLAVLGQISDTALTRETENMISAETLDAMKPGAWLINVARGRLVDERALLRALRDGRIGGAILDTFRDEPLQPSSPFYDLPNVIVTPHTSWSSARVLDRSVELFCDNLRKFATGEPLLNVVDPNRGY